MGDVKETRIVKLNNSNYSVWKYKMELILIKENLWEKVMKERVVPPIPAGTEAEIAAAEEAAVAATEEWKKWDNKARASIGLAVEDDQLGHIRKKTTAWGSWEALRNYHEKTTLSNKVHVMREICNLKLHENGNVEEHINKMSDLFQKLVDIGEQEISESWNVAMLLSSLPRSYDTLITALEAREEDDLNFAFVQQKVLAEYQRRNNNLNDESDSALTVKSVECYFCKKTGHMKKDCTLYKTWLSKQGEKENQNTLNAVAKKIALSDEFYQTDYSF